MTRRSLYFEEPGRVALREEALPPPGPGQVLVQTRLSGISPGTELLIYRGQAPRQMAADVNLPALQGTLAYPLKYGYSLVGEVVAAGSPGDETWLGKLVFAFHPHEDYFLAKPEDLWPVPPEIAPEDAVFLANMETAVTLTLDGRPLVGEKVVVFGQGIVGLLLTGLLARFPLARLVTLDPLPQRRLVSETLGAHMALDPGDPEALTRVQQLLAGEGTEAGADLTYEVSGNPAALDQALMVTGFAGRLVIGSWYGTKTVTLNLGGEFHRQRQVILSSQVSTIAPSLRGRWHKPRLLRTAWEMLKEVQPSRFITQRLPFTQAEAAYRLLDQKPEEAIQVVFTY